MRTALAAILFYVLAITPCRSQVIYKNLVLEGAGVRGFAYSGAFSVLDSLGILQSIERVGGTSAGAIEATLLAIGYTPAELNEAAYNAPLKHFNDGAWLIFGGFNRFHQQFGWYKGDRITKWIGALIAAKTGNENITFGELHQLRLQKGYRDLYITGTDLTFQCLRIFSYENYPNMRIKDAVRISASIPLYYEAVLIDDSGKVYQKQQDDKQLHVMADGGLLSNYPLFMFDSARYMPAHSDTLPCRLENPETLGLLMELPEQIEYSKHIRGNYPLEIKTVHQYFKAIFRTAVDKANPEASGLYSTKRTIMIDDLHLSPRVRKLSRKTIDALIESGREGVRRYFILHVQASS